MNPTPLTYKWEDLPDGDIGATGEHAYYQIHENKVTGKFHLGRRLGDQEIKLVGYYGSLEEAKGAAESREASL